MINLDVDTITGAVAGAPRIDRSDCSARRHGDAAAYTYHRCRCADAREDHRLRTKRRRQGRAVPLEVDSTGSARRLQALAALGWNLAALAPQLGMTVSRVQYLQTQQSATALRRTAARVAAVYARLSMTPGPSDRTRRHALRAGWEPPLAWDDDVLDDPRAEPAVRTPAALRSAPDEKRVRRALAGDMEARRAMRSADLRLAVRLLHAEGLPDVAIAERARMSPQTVRTIRNELCLPVNHQATRKRAG
jgi:hypothetical protein